MRRRGAAREFPRPWLAGGALLAAALTTAFVTVAIAQPRKGAAPKPKPPKTAVDGGATEGVDEGASASATNAASSDGGAASAPIKPEMADGGKPSPLNPQPNELPNGTTPAVGLTTTADYDKILGEISALRARVAAVQDGLFRSRIAIALRADADHVKIGKLSVSLDDGVVYAAKPNFKAEDLAAIYEHAVSPGRHAITVDVELQSANDEAFRTSQRSRFVVEVPKDQRLGVELRVSDDSTMGADFPGDRSGLYDLRVRLKATARAVTR